MEFGRRSWRSILPLQGVKPTIGDSQASSRGAAEGTGPGTLAKDGQILLQATWHNKPLNSGCRDSPGATPPCSPCAPGSRGDRNKREMPSGPTG